VSVSRGGCPDGVDPAEHDLLELASATLRVALDGDRRLARRSTQSSLALLDAGSSGRRRALWIEIVLAAQVARRP
jgi:hypothetical protein